MEREITLAMRLVGATRVEELVPEMVNFNFERKILRSADMLYPGRTSFMAARPG